MSSETTTEWLTDEEGRKYRLHTVWTLEGDCGDCVNGDEDGCCQHGTVCDLCRASGDEETFRDYFAPKPPTTTVPTADLDALRDLVANPPTCVDPDAAEDLARDADWCDWHGKLVEAVEAMGGQES